MFLDILFTIMGRNALVLLPSLQKRLTEVGANIRIARLRRRLTAEQVSERAGITRPTLRAIERGDPNVTFGAYANVLLCLGLEKDLNEVAKNDPLGQKLVDAEITTIAHRAPKRTRTTKIPRKAPRPISEKPE